MPKHRSGVPHRGKGGVNVGEASRRCERAGLYHFATGHGSPGGPLWEIYNSASGKLVGRYRPRHRRIRGPSIPLAVVRSWNEALRIFVEARDRG